MVEPLINLPSLSSIRRSKINLKQERYVNNRVAGCNQREAALGAGYSESTADSACRLDKILKDDIREALEKAGLTNEFLCKKIFEKATSDNESIQIKALEMVAKLKKYYSDVNVDNSQHKHFTIKWEPNDDGSSNRIVKFEE